MQICLHVVEDQVDVAIVLRPEDLLERNDVLVPLQKLQKDNLPIGALRVGGVLKGVKDLFERHNLSTRVVGGRSLNAT